VKDSKSCEVGGQTSAESSHIYDNCADNIACMLIKSHRLFDLSGIHYLIIAPH